MNIVIINDNATVNGGASKIAIASAAGLAARGHRVFFLCATGPIAPELRHSHIEVVCTNQHEILDDPNRFRAVSQGLWNIRSQRRASELFAALDPKETVVHIHLWAKALSSSVLRGAIQRRFPIALTLHDFLLACPTGTLFNHREQKICQLQPMGWDCLRTNCDTRRYSHKLWRVARQFVQTNLGEMPGAITDFIFYSDLVLSVMKSLLPSEAQMHRVANFVDLCKPEPAAVATNDHFVFSGRLVKEKGAIEFARCAKRESLLPLFIGDGECRDEVTKAYDGAEITGWLPYQDVQTQLRRARAFVFPSLWYETQGLVVLEAASNGIPAIVPDTSAAREMVVDGQTGLWFKGGDDHDLCAKLRLLKDPVLAADMGAAAYKRYWSNPATVDRHIEGVEHVYRAMMVRSLQLRSAGELAAMRA